MIIILLFLIIDILLIVLSIYFVVKLKWLFSIFTIIGLYFFVRWTILFLFNYSHWARAHKFWRLVRKNPEKFIGVFRERNNTWKVIDSEIAKKIFDKLEKGDGWVGSFMLRIPSTGKIVFIYGKDGLYQEEQEKILNLIAKNNK
jgi:ABC-type multidrug transport system fused ATPase/permease subunit